MKKILISASFLVAVLLIGLRTLPIYSQDVPFCTHEGYNLRKSLIQGDSKQSIDKEVEKISEAHALFSCGAEQTIKLYVI